MRACVGACVRACVCVRECVCVRVCARACLYVFLRACSRAWTQYDVSWCVCFMRKRDSQIILLHSLLHHCQYIEAIQVLRNSMEGGGVRFRLVQRFECVLPTLLAFRGGGGQIPRKQLIT